MSEHKTDAPDKARFEKIKSVLATDCGSTTTKAILIELKDGEYRLTARGARPSSAAAE